jgi:hypothetical protein
MTRAARWLLPALVIVLLAPALLVPRPAVAANAPRTIRVPQDAASVQAAVTASAPGDLILLDRGTYPGGVEVPKEKDHITIRGVDRNGVVFDGRGVSLNAIEVHADGVSLENMTAHDFTGNGFYWDQVDGFTGRYLTVWNVRTYGIYAIQSRRGLFEDSLASGAADAAFYIGECQPCDTTMRRLIGRYSAIGYSGTNAGGGLELRDSTWERNGTAIMPNSYEGQEAPPPQRSMVIAGNTIRDSGRVPVPGESPLAGFVGVGIAIAGGYEDTVEGNRIEGSANYGIAIFPTLQPGGARWAPRGNVVRNNVVSGSGKADLAASQGLDVGNCFAGNQFATSRPLDIESAMACGRPPPSAGSTEGDGSVGADLAVPPGVARDRLGDRPSYRDMPMPEAQPTMAQGQVEALPSQSAAAASAPSPPSSGPLPSAPAPAVPLFLLAGVAAIGAAVLVAAVWRLRRDRPRN